MYLFIYGNDDCRAYGEASSALFVMILTELTRPVAEHILPVIACRRVVTPIMTSHDRCMPLFAEEFLHSKCGNFQFFVLKAKSGS